MRTVHHFSDAEKTVIYTMALKFVAEYREAYAEYLRDCESDRRNGNRAHYCEHGTNLWTDYDNICGPCEDGLTLAYGPWKYERALAEAKARFVAIDEILRVRRSLSRQFSGYESPEMTKLLNDAADVNTYFGHY